MQEVADVLGSLKEYLCFLMENGVLETPAPEGLPAPLLGGAGAAPEELLRPLPGTSCRAPEGLPAPLPGGSGADLKNRGPVSAERLLAGIRDELAECGKCPLSRGRKNIVFGEGNPKAEIVLVGEGPGAEEDETGRPFVGRAGQLLSRMIENALGMPRQEVYICNIVKCRPPGNRTPGKEEIQACLPFVERQIEAIRPRVIMTLGKPAACALLRVNEPIHLLRGKWREYRGIPLMPTFHPAYVLRQYTLSVRRQVFDDIREVLKFLGRSG